MVHYFRQQKLAYQFEEKPFFYTDPTGYTAHLLSKGKSRMEHQDHPEDFEDANVAFTHDEEQKEGELEGTPGIRTPEEFKQILDQTLLGPSIDIGKIDTKTRIPIPMTSVQAAPTAPAAPTTTAPNISISTVIATPDNFDGKVEHFQTFWAAVKAYISINAAAFPTEAHKILFVLSRCKGGVTERWATTLINRFTDTGKWGTFADFEKLFKQTFYPEVTTNDAIWKLATMKFTEWMMLKDFEMLWDTATFESGLTPDLMHWHYFSAKLPRKLYDELMRLETEPTTYNGWRAAMRKIDARQN